MLRLVRVLLSVIVATGLVVLGTSAAASASVGDKKIKKCATKTASKAIAKALAKTMNAETGEDSAKVMDVPPDQFDAFAAALQQAKDASTPSGVELKVINVKATCQGKTSASFTFDIAADDGTVVAPGQEGDAVLKKGKWLLNPVNACDNLGRNPQPAILAAATACYAALGVQGNVCPVNDPRCGPAPGRP